MHGGGGIGTDEKINMRDVDFEKLPPPPEEHLFFKIFFPLKWLFVWVEGIVYKGFRNKIDVETIPILPSGKRVDKNLKSFYKWWNFYSKMKKNRLLFTLYTMFGIEWVWAGILQAVSTLIMVFVPRIMSEFLSSLMPVMPEAYETMFELAQHVLPEELAPNSSDFSFRKDDYSAWLLLLGFVVAYFFSNFLQIASQHISVSVGMKQRSVLMAAMYEKSLKLSNKAKATFETGTIINYVSTDTMRVEAISSMFHFGWTSIITFIGSLIFLVDLIDYGTLSVLGMPVITVPIIITCMVLFIQSRKASMKVTDERVRRTNEFLQGIKIIKFFTWEKTYIELITKIRKKEINFSIFQNLIMSLLFSVFLTTPALMTIAGFVTFFFIHQQIDAITIFTSLTYINMLQAPVSILPMTVIGLLESFVSIGRMENLLKADELPPSKHYKDLESPIEIENGTFQWEVIKTEKKKKKLQLKKKKKEKKPSEVEMVENGFSLKNINLKIQKGELVTVVGKVGSGKSSLLQAILSEMKIVNGEVRLSGSVSYCSQTPWIMNATLLENILFGKELDEEKFDEVARVCSLKKDLEILKGGRNIEIGEKGINLSGGQKYRASLARAVYSDSDVILLDDPLAAVDAHVGKSILEKCILNYLKGKTRILVTHQIQACEHADRVILLENGEIVENGTYNDLMAKRGKFFKLISENLALDEKKEKKEEKDNEEEAGTTKTEEENKLIGEEEKGSGMIGLKILNSYIKAGGGWIILIFVIFLFLIDQVLKTGNSWFLSEWSAGTFSEEFGSTFTSTIYMNATMYYNTSTHSNELLFGYFDDEGEFVSYYPEYYDADSMNCPVNNLNFSSTKPLGICTTYDIDIVWDRTYSNGTLVRDGLSQTESVAIYGGTGVSQFFSTYIKAIFLGFFCLFAGRTLHKRVLNRVAFAPMRFFDTTPIGRVLNRFSTDFEVLDTRLTRTLSSLMGMGLNVIGTFGLMAYATNGLFVVFLIPLGIIYFFIYVYYRKSALELRRIYSVSRSPVFSHISETLTGMPTIRAYGRVKDFEDENVKRIDFNNCSFYSMRSAQRWLAMRLQMLGVVIIISVCSISIVLMYYGGDWATTNISYISLGVSYSFSISRLLSMLFTQFTEAEVMLNSVERVYEYSEKLEQEREHESKGDENLKNKKWPEKGVVEFKNFYLRYREGLPFVLKDINIKFRPAEKVGIVGRTGSGKSTLMVALFRLVESAEGCIEIDGVDTRTIGLKALRSTLSIIPQDPVLFYGTIRSNMDPFNNHTDEEIINALKESSMEKLVDPKINPQGIEARITENGENLSAGERQLLCLARALLRKSKVMIMDECTASVDVNSDKIIQETIRKLTGTTILTIAHRINTIIDYDRVLVMEKGQIAEFDTPRNLLSRKKYHIFKELVDETGVSNSVFLKKFVFGDKYDDYIEEEKKNKKEVEITIQKEKEERFKFGEFMGNVNGKKSLISVNRGFLIDQGGEISISIGDIEKFVKKDSKSTKKFIRYEINDTFSIGIDSSESELFEKFLLSTISENEEKEEE